MRRIDLRWAARLAASRQSSALGVKFPRGASGEVSLENGPPERPVCPAPAKILIVDDDTAIRRLLTALLRQDFVTVEAASGEEALETLSGFAADVLLLDIMLPGLDGWEICRRVKSGPSGAHVQVIMVSAKSSKAEQLRAYEPAPTITSSSPSMPRK